VCAEGGVQRHHLDDGPWPAFGAQGPRRGDPPAHAHGPRSCRWDSALLWTVRTRARRDPGMGQGDPADTHDPVHGWGRKAMRRLHMRAPRQQQEIPGPYESAYWHALPDTRGRLQLEGLPRS